MNALAYKSSPKTQPRRLPYKGTKFSETSPRRIYSPSRSDHIAKFYAALNKWRSETALSSSLDEILAHQSYSEIVALGMPAVELLLSELSIRPGLEVYALEDIMGLTPYPDEILGDIPAMSERWLRRSVEA